MSGIITPVSQSAIAIIEKPRKKPVTHTAKRPAPVLESGLPPRHSWRGIVFAAVLGLGFVAIAAQLLVESFFGGRYLPGVTVAGQSLGGMTRSEAHQVLSKSIQSAAITFKVGTKEYRRTPDQVGAGYDLNATLDQAYLVGRSHHQFAPLGLWDALHQPDNSYSYTTTGGAQKAFIDEVVAASGKAPTNATIVMTAGVPTVQQDGDGYALSYQEIARAIDASLRNPHAPPPTLEPSKQPARVQAADAAKAIEPTKKLLATPVTITYQGRSFTPSTNQMDDWVKFETTTSDQAPGLIPKINPDGIKHYLQSISKTVNIEPVNRKVDVQDGTSIERQVGKDGQQLDQDALANQISSSLTAHTSLTTEAPLKPVPFKTEYNRSVSLDYAQYIEINLSRQHLWVYQDHQVIFDSPITSGATGAGFPTVTGLFSVKAKQTNRNLNGYAIGYNYNVFVKYWMPFSGDYGMHDASWRSSFGGADYYRNGSHGCVNMPDATAAWIFNWASVGTPVWVHN